jgi:hypothetical protein
MTPMNTDREIAKEVKGKVVGRQIESFPRALDLL